MKTARINYSFRAIALQKRKQKSVPGTEFSIHLANTRAENSCMWCFKYGEPAFQDALGLIGNEIMAVALAKQNWVYANICPPALATLACAMVTMCYLQCVSTTK